MSMSQRLSLCLAAMLALPSASQAALLSRIGGLAYYDTKLNITWLADASPAASNTLGVLGASENGNGPGNMSWDAANAWIAALNASDYLGFGDWRLPTMKDPGTCDFSRIGGTDCGLNVRTTNGGTVYSELATLFYDTLTNKALYDIHGNAPQPGWSVNPNAGPFLNLQNDYWFGVEYADNPNFAWLFSFSSGGQNVDNKATGFTVWAVRDGDVAPIPLPPACWLLGSALTGLGFVRRHLS